MELLLSKYIKAFVSYEGLNRIEKYPLPEAALREALLNAIAHKDYNSGNPIQIKVYDNKVTVWNEGELPPNWTIKHLHTEHPSQPYNPDIANTFSKAGLIEAWGQGTLRIIDECKKYRFPSPIFLNDLSGFKIEFKFPVQETEKRIINQIANNPDITINDLAFIIAVSESTIERIIKKLQKNGKLIRTGSKKAGKWKLI